MVLSIVRLLRFASVVICLIVIASFGTFAIEQTKSASNHQQEELGSKPVHGSESKRKPGQTLASPHEGSVHKAIDEAAGELTSPFSGVVSGASSEWAIRGVKLLLALVVYGFGIGYLARTLRVRV